MLLSLSFLFLTFISLLLPLILIVYSSSKKLLDKIISSEYFVFIINVIELFAVFIELVIELIE